jgi:hypothetical protein
MFKKDIHFTGKPERIVIMGFLCYTKKTINGMTKSIVNKIFYDISENVRNASIENEDDILEFCEAVLKRE